MDCGPNPRKHSISQHTMSETPVPLTMSRHIFPCTVKSN